MADFVSLNALTNKKAPDGAILAYGAVVGGEGCETTYVVKDGHVASVSLKGDECYE